MYCKIQSVKITFLKFTFYTTFEEGADGHQKRARRIPSHPQELEEGVRQFSCHTTTNLVIKKKMILSLLEVLYSLRNYLLQSVLKYLDQETEHPTSDKPY